MENKSSSVKRVQESLNKLNLTTEIIQLPDSTRTAREAAAAVGCYVGQIIKSLVFQGKQSQKAILILTSGVNMVNEKGVVEVLGEEIKFAPADFVREETGFAIGGVSPLGLKKDLEIYIDEDLLSHDEIWAAAGSPHTVFKIQPQILVEATGGTVIKVK
jgi:prolyl-tRNA editing enzyme YbaK/EbsC (Cys-tRNA(Pro) deacylase)